MKQFYEIQIKSMLYNFQIKLSWKNCFKWCLLWTVSLVYYSFFKLWFFYRFFLTSPKQVNIPVISIGNITVGGTGKTPMIDWFLDFFETRKISSAILTRGYSRTSTKEMIRLQGNIKKNQSCEEFGDEPWMLSKKHPSVPIFISKNRYQAAKIAKKEASVLLLDDGMQHLALARDVEIVLIDSIAGFGNNHLLPLGPLREPLHHLNRADVILFTKTKYQKVNNTLLKTVTQNIRKNTPIFYSELIPVCFYSSSNLEKYSLKTFEDKPCRLFSGIGNPKGFEQTIASLGIEIQEHWIFKDHAKYENDLIKKLIEWCKQDDTPILTTEKDWVKLESIKNQLPEIYYIEIKVKIDSSFEQFLFKKLDFV